ncbi:hypothetical protein [Pseudomonas sp. dw_358]|uniref:hypothetical protein n=1 Tax=Pseudomonas sp. dw_358 TaxID=2720083 RepID=UPI001BD49E28|nr:hypothetical protein [Pseudomonas sp. dw_358]
MAKPYAFINEHMQTFMAIQDRLRLNRQGLAKLNTLNGHLLNTVVMPGQLVVVGDDSTNSCSSEETELQRMGLQARQSLSAHQAGGDGFILKNYDLLQSLLGYTSLGVGSVTSAWSKHLEGVKQTLEEIDVLHKNALKRGTPIARHEFHEHRKILFKKLDVQLEGIARFGTGLRNHGSIRRMLGISTKSYLSTGEIKGYSDKLARVAKTARILSKGTYVGLALDISAGALEIVEACSSGRSAECRRAGYVETSKTAFSILGSTAIGGIVGYYAVGVCMSTFGLATGGVGVLGCAIIGGAGGGWAGGLGGEIAGEKMGTIVYEHLGS